VSGTIHTFHPDTLEAGLSDDCPRCSEHANDPLRSLDEPHLADLWRRMLAAEYGDGGMYRSHAEARACRQLVGHARFLRSIGIDPQDVVPGERYLQVRSRVLCPGCGYQLVSLVCPRCETDR
jgi:hypothetical protein